MTGNAKRAITFVLFAVGLVLGLLGWVADVYPSTTGTILFICFILASWALRIYWGIRRGSKSG